MAGFGGWEEYQQWARRLLRDVRELREEAYAYTPEVGTSDTGEALNNLRNYAGVLERVALEHANFVYQAAPEEHRRRRAE